MTTLLSLLLLPRRRLVPVAGKVVNLVVHEDVGQSVKGAGVQESEALGQPAAVPVGSAEISSKMKNEKYPAK